MIQLFSGHYFFPSQVLSIQNHVTTMEVPYAYPNGTNVTLTLSDICLKPLEGDNDNCAIMSPLQWFQNNETNLDFTVYNEDEWTTCDFLEQIKGCAL